MWGDVLTGWVFAVIPVVHLLGAATAMHALFRVRTPQGTIAWVLGLTLVPWLALPAYFVFGRGHFATYVRALRKARILAAHENEHFGELVSVAMNAHAVESDRDVPLTSLLRAPFSTGHEVHLLIDADETYQALLEAIDGAKSFILFQFFIVRADSAGHLFGERLKAAARRGVAVFVLYDEVGSRGLSRSWLKALGECGVRVAAFGTRELGWGRTYMNFRNHRKLVVVDGRRAFVGGLNIGDEYLGKNPRLSPWRDTHVAVTGPVVGSLLRTFVQDWYWATRETLSFTVDGVHVGAMVALAAPTGPLSEHPSCELVHAQLIQRATRRLWWSTPYFVPTPGIQLAFRLAVLRGVDLRILLPDRWDHVLSSLAALVYLHEMRDSGIRFFRMTGAFVHQKVVLVDDDLAMVSSANLDSRSFCLNFELGVLVRDQRFAQQTRAMLERDFSRSREVVGEYAKSSSAIRVLARLARLASPVL